MAHIAMYTIKVHRLDIYILRPSFCYQWTYGAALKDWLGLSRSPFRPVVQITDVGIGWGRRQRISIRSRARLTRTQILDMDLIIGQSINFWDAGMRTDYCIEDIAPYDYTFLHNHPNAHPNIYAYTYFIDD